MICVCWRVGWHLEDGSIPSPRPEVEIIEPDVLVAGYPAVKAAHNKWCKKILVCTAAESNLAAMQASLAANVEVVTKAKALVESSAASVESIPLVVSEDGGGAKAETKSAANIKKTLADAEKRLVTVSDVCDRSRNAVAAATADLEAAQASVSKMHTAFKEATINPDRCDIDAFGSTRRRDIAAMQKVQSQGSNNRLSMYGSGEQYFKTARGVEMVYNGIAAQSPLAETMVNKPQSHRDKVQYIGSRGPCIRSVLVSYDFCTLIPC
jgi:hypothetical protein